MKKRLYRIEEGKMIAGVCGGILAYIIAALIIPVKSQIK